MLPFDELDEPSARKRRGGITSHEKGYQGVTNTWLTPRWVIEALGPFDMDPCASNPRPFDCAARNICEAEDGFSVKWEGLVWLNPPYGPQVGKWLGRLIEHGNGIALIFARTETRAMQYALSKCTVVKFIEKRICFTNEYGVTSQSAGAPSMLLAFGEEAALRVARQSVPGLVFKLVA